VSAEAALLPKGADPRDADSVYRAAAMTLRGGLDAEALSLALAGAARHPGDARMWQMAALAHRELEDLAPAVAAIGRAAALVPNDALIAHTRARVALEAGLPAAHLFQSALALAPDDPIALLGQVAAWFAEGEPGRALAVLDACLAVSPGWSEGHATFARLRWMQGERASFTSSFERALAASPRQAGLWTDLVGTLMHAAFYDEALAATARGRAAAGDDPAFDALEAVCRAELGQTEAADRLFERPGIISNVAMAVRYLRHLLRAGRPAEASAFAEGWSGRDPDHLLIPYLSAAWRLTGDPRWEWLEGDPAMIGVYDLAESLPLLDALADRLRGLHLASFPPLEQSLRGGTQTDGPLLARIEPEIRALRAILVEAVERHVAALPPPRPGHPLLAAKRAPIRFAGSWSVRLAGAGYHVDHVHPAGWISSAFYVSLPDAGMGGDHHSGWLSLGEANELGLDLPPIRLVEPKPGRLVLFPSTMWHGTRPFAAGERLTIAFDIARPRQ
jgi:tetratricopeptide (TPR) repeat protein